MASSVRFVKGKPQGEGNWGKAGVSGKNMGSSWSRARISKASQKVQLKAGIEGGERRSFIACGGGRRAVPCIGSSQGVSTGHTVQIRFLTHWALSLLLLVYYSHGWIVFEINSIY